MVTLTKFDHGLSTSDIEDVLALPVDLVKRTYVSRYLVTRHYGGPEEGGWWYDRHKFIDVALVFNVPCDGDQWMTHPGWIACRALNESRTSNRYSVNDTDGDFTWDVEFRPGVNDDTDEPRPWFE